MGEEGERQRTKKEEKRDEKEEAAKEGLYNHMNFAMGQAIAMLLCIVKFVRHEGIEDSWFK